MEREQEEINKYHIKAATYKELIMQGKLKIKIK